MLFIIYSGKKVILFFENIQYYHNIFSINYHNGLWNEKKNQRKIPKVSITLIYIYIYIYISCDVAWHFFLKKGKCSLHIYKHMINDSLIGRENLNLVPAWEINVSMNQSCLGLFPTRWTLARLCSPSYSLLLCYCFHIPL